MSDLLKFQMLSGTVGELVLNQPAKRNALTAGMWDALPHKLKAAEETENLRLLIIRGEGEHFSAGADISEFSTLYATPENAAKASSSIAAAMKALAATACPTIAMIRGACAGGGCALALACDIRFADDTAKFAVTPARLGLVYPYEDIQRLIGIVGLANAKDMILSSRVIKAQEAIGFGLINFCHKPEALETAVMEYAESLSVLSPSSLKVMKNMAQSYQDGQRGDNEKTREQFQSAFTSRDFTEGFSAFMAKRKPDFK